MTAPASTEHAESRDQAARLRALMEEARSCAPGKPETATPAPSRSSGKPALAPNAPEFKAPPRPRMSLAALKARQSSATRPAAPVALKPPPSVRAPLREGWGDPSAAAAALRPIDSHRPSPAGVDQAVILAVASGKGGVGKTSLCVNLCVTLARKGVRCALIDGDIGLANADVMCGVRASRNLGHVLAGECPLRDALAPAPGGFLLAAGSTTHAVGRCEAGIDRIIDEARLLTPRCDAVVIDCGAGAGDTVLRFLVQADTRLIVATPEPTSLADAYAVLKRLVWRERELTATRSGAVGAISVVVNQAVDSEEARRAFRRIESVAERFLSVSPTLLGWIPRDQRLADSVRARSPVAVRRRRAPSARAIARLGARLTARGAISARARQGWMRRALGGLGGMRGS